MIFQRKLRGVCLKISELNSPRARQTEFAAANLINTLYGSLEYNATEYYTIDVMPGAIYTKDHNAIAERLKKARIKAGLGQVEVAKKLGKTQSYLSKIESGQRRFDVLQLKEFAKLYKKPLDYFLK